jgi:hypothetical protein
MTLKLVDAPGPQRIKSQQELDEIFAKVSTAAKKMRSAARPALDMTEARHVLDVYNKVVADGRFVKVFPTDPGGAAKKLGLTLSQAEIDEIHEMTKASTGVREDCVIVIVIAICIVIAFGPRDDAPDAVIDSSGKIKL